MTTEELKHYYSIYYLDYINDKVIKYYDLGFNNRFFTKSEAANTIINSENKQFEGLTLTILEIFES